MQVPYRQGGAFTAQGPDPPESGQRVTELRVPTLNANDSAYTLVAWLAADGSTVATGSPVAELETSKAVEEIGAPADGVLVHAAAVGTDVAPGQLLATVGPRAADPPAATGPSADPIAATGPSATPGPAATTPATDPAAATVPTTAAIGGPTTTPVITAPARARMAELGVTEDQVRRLPLPVVRRADIDHLASAPSGPPSHDLSRGQRAVARAVSHSHATIPAAYTVIRVDAGAALARARTLTRQVRQPVTLANLVIAAVATLRPRFPLCYGRLTESTVYPAATADVGVTVDVGTGLYLPVVREADALDPAALAHRLADVRARAAAGTFRESDLDGAAISVTLHTDPDILLAVPFVFPGQLCALAVAAPLAGFVPGDDGSPVARTFVHIGLSYDHRAVNGAAAAGYLGAVRDALA